MSCAWLPPRAVSPPCRAAHVAASLSVVRDGAKLRMTPRTLLLTSAPIDQHQWPACPRGGEGRQRIDAADMEASFSADRLKGEMVLALRQRSRH